MCEATDRYKELRREFFGLDQSVRLGPKGIKFKLSYLRSNSRVRAAIGILTGKTPDLKADLSLLRTTTNYYLDDMANDLSELTNVYV